MELSKFFPLFFFFNVTISFVSRKFNRAAHNLAKFGVKRENCFEWVESFPSSLISLNSLM